MGELQNICAKRKREGSADFSPHFEILDAVWPVGSI